MCLIIRANDVHCIAKKSFLFSVIILLIFIQQPLDAEVVSFETNNQNLSFLKILKLKSHAFFQYWNQCHNCSILIS